ncbi:phosphoribosyl-AMP cyclohydrolase [Propionimicrobium sp. PCR01-08-3]|uniref:phosphoribosyl-AMP cyclohydrolase n=1 Tax=Propionimicrobium sp. PCR01-08-3 TaxID=3052086 RepID=UPI00255CCD5F|nr:phosphoribosyl-AMP cyclohydrolase [Propionimicrobium sp. PCR01-08-3]WIY83857.1 phosphoribosyl-AMP cyclohydrolase [Propionimicrobium sp. PCR01-08-3]
MPESMPALSPEIASKLKRNADGLVPAVVQDATSGRVLMMAWMSDDSLALTLQTRQATYWSRSRQELWRKGATSGNTQQVRELSSDCDGDTLLMIVDQQGPACHTGAESCFDAGGVLLADDSTGASGAEIDQAGHHRTGEAAE